MVTSLRLRTLAVMVLVACAASVAGQLASSAREKSYIGFDRNEYPGDAHLAALRKTFAFSGYWLNAPPGANENTWVGKRDRLREAGFGFLVLFNGRLDAELRKAPDAGELGRRDATSATVAAQREGFPPHAVIFLDQEEGGRMLPEQKAYIFAWVNGVTAAGFRAGIYCSGIEVTDSTGSIATAADLRQSTGDRQIVYWVTNDACPPSPGCAVPRKAPLAGESGIVFAEVWQYAQSPKRRDVARGCTKNYAQDDNCYPPGLEKDKVFVDLDVAASPDPSVGR
jgi:hypothetical protein